MLDILDKYLKDAASPEMRDMLLEAHRCFDRVEFPNYQDTFTNILMADGDVAEGDTLSLILGSTLEIQRQILLEHDVVLTDEATIDTHTIFITGVLDLAEYGDKKTVLDLLALGREPNELFAELLALTTGKTPDELLYVVESVSPAFISNIKDYFAHEEETDGEYLADRQKYVDNIKYFCEYMQTKNLMTLDLIKSGLDVGMPFKTYADIIGRELEGMSDEKASNELIAMAIVSSDGAANPISVISANIENYISSLDKVTRITVIVNELVLRLQR